MNSARIGVGFIPWGGHPLLDELTVVREKLRLSVEKARETADEAERTAIDLPDLAGWEDKYKSPLARSSPEAVADLIRIHQCRYDHSIRLAVAADAQSKVVVIYQEVYFCLVRLVLGARWDWNRADYPAGQRDQSGYILAQGLSYNQWRILRHNLVALQEEYKQAQGLAGELSGKLNRASLPVGDEPISDQFYRDFPWLADQSTVERWKADLKVQDPTPLPRKGCG